ncbi:MAG TPA: SufS family cysteine desulfurase [Gemmatimonadaceae bacterium]|nr:SufS family cysteine desulfurase [Gemmatimonadaceae bacterium]
MSALAPRADFPLLAADPRLVYLDSAATAQKPRAVLDAIAAFYAHDYANPHRGAYALSARATAVYRAARERVARFLGAADADTLLFTRGCTESLNLVAGTWGRANVAAGDRIVVTAAEHHGNFVPWQQLALERGAEFRIAPLAADGTVDRVHLASLLGPRTKVVAFTHVSNVLGAINPVEEIVALVRAAAPQAITVCDGAQAAPHLPVSVDALGVDFYAAGGHKMLGPMGVGVLVGRRALLEAMPPWLTGGDMIEFVHDERSTWNVIPHKFEAGTPNVEGAVGLAAACDYLDALGMARVHEHGRRLATLAIEGMLRLPGARTHGPPAGAERAGVVSFTLGEVHPHDLSSILDAKGVCIRAGHHCAQPLMRRLGAGATARASFSVYNDERDVEALLAGMRAALDLFAHA